MTARAAVGSVLVVLGVAVAGCQCAPPGAICSSDEQCAGLSGRTICSTEGQCIECLGADDCASGVCRGDGTCARCSPTAACPAGLVCSPSGDCVQPCTDGCPEGQLCLVESNTCAQCLTSDDCGDGHLCTPEHVCEPGCSASHPQCPNGQVCQVSRGRCVGCVTFGDCHNPLQPVCDPATNSCVPCVGSSDCPLGSLCDGNACVPGCDATHGCAAPLVCDVGGQKCVACVLDAHCGGATPRCDPSTHTCVACLPGPGDNCPAGFYCRPDRVCERGCKTGADCRSATCLPNHSCAGCTSDQECAAGGVCDQGTCVPGCSQTNPCGGQSTCCNQHCVDSQNDVNNCGGCGIQCGAGDACCAGVCKSLSSTTACGACGNACKSGEGCCSGKCTSLSLRTSCGTCQTSCGPQDVCNGTTCVPPTFPNFCANKDVYVIYDMLPVDDGAANVLASTITQYCPNQPTMHFGPQTDPTLVDQGTGQPKVGPAATIVMAGGPWPSKPVKWLELTGKWTRVYFDQNMTSELYFKKRSDGSKVTTFPTSLCSPHRDQFVVELVTDPGTGTLALIAYGLCGGGYGTQAAAWFYANQLLPNRSNFPDSWYVYDWSDTHNNSAPDAADTFTLLAHGQ